MLEAVAQGRDRLGGLLLAKNCGISGRLTLIHASVHHCCLFVDALSFLNVLRDFEVVRFEALQGGLVLMSVLVAYRGIDLAVVDCFKAKKRLLYSILL